MKNIIVDIMSHPKISVIVPVYNVEEFLKTCLDSVCNQTFEDIEIICINDGSTDSSPDILQAYSKKDSRIKVYNQENKGLGFVRNIGMEYASGDYVYFIDSDDHIALNTLELAYDNITSNDADMVIFKYLFCRADDTFTVDRFDIDKQFPGVDFNNFTISYKSIKYYVLFGSSPPWHKLFKRDFLNKYDDLVFPLNIAYEDLFFHVKSILRASSISILPEYLYFYKKDNSSSITNNPKNHIDIFRHIKIIREFLEKEGFMEEFKTEFKSFKVNQIMYHFAPPFTEEFYVKAKAELADVDSFDRTFVDDKNYDKYMLFKSTGSLIEFSNAYYIEEINELNNKINRLNNEKNQLNKEFNKLNANIKDLKKEKQSLLNSKSFKVTKPLRSVVNFFR